MKFKQYLESVNEKAKALEGDFETVKSMLKNYNEFLDKRLKDLKQDKYSKLDYARGQTAAFEDAKELLDDILKRYEQILKESEEKEVKIGSKVKYSKGNAE